MHPFWTLERSSIGAVREYLPGASNTPEHVEPPANLLVDQTYRPLIHTMLRRSPTFRRQCVRLANEPRLWIHLQINTRPRSAFYRATTRFSREQPGRLTAEIEIAQGTNAVELIAHELEHIIEQLDEIDLALQAALDATGVRSFEHDGRSFETLRAQTVGLQVAREASAKGHRRD